MEEPAETQDRKTEGTVRGRTEKRGILAGAAMGICKLAINVCLCLIGTQCTSESRILEYLE